MPETTTNWFTFVDSNSRRFLGLEWFWSWNWNWGTWSIEWNSVDNSKQTSCMAFSSWNIYKLEKL